MVFRGWKLDKKGEEVVMPEVVLIILTIIFFGVLLIFIAKAASSSLFYEEVYAKKIGLSIEAAKPGTILEFNISKPYIISKENKFEESFRDKFFYFDNEENSVTIKLASEGGYKFKLMSLKSVSNPVVNIDELNKKYVLVLSVGK